MSSSLESVEEHVASPGQARLVETGGEPIAPARRFYGWLMLPMAMLVMIGTSPGQTFGIAYFNSHFRAELGLSQTGLSAIYLVATVLAALTLPYLGSLVDRHGLRRATIVTVAAMSVACVFTSQVGGTVTLFFAFFFLRMIGPGTMVLLANNTLAAWFDRRLGMAIGLMQVAMAGAIATVPTGIVALIDLFGWRGAYFALGAVLGGGLLPLLVAAYRQSPAELGQLADGARQHSFEASQRAERGMTVRQATQQRAYWILLAAVAYWALVGTGIIFHLDAIFKAHGLGVRESARAITMMATAMAAMQIMGGLSADRLAVRWLVVAAVALLGVSCAMLATDRPEWLGSSYVVYGFAQGLMTIVAGTSWARYFGRKHLGKIRGTSLTAAVGASSIGPLVMGISTDYAGGFAPSLWLFAAVSVVIAVAAIWATPPKMPPARASEK